MTEEDARRLADRIVATWPAGAKHYIWKGVLLELDHHAADVTYRQLRDNAMSTPTPGNYLACYRQTRNRLTASPTLFEADENVISVVDYLERHPDDEHWSNIRERFEARQRHPSSKELP